MNWYTCPYDNSWLKKFLHSAHLAEVSLSLLHCFSLLSNSNWYGVVCVCVFVSVVHVWRRGVVSDEYEWVL